MILQKYGVRTQRKMFVPSGAIMNSFFINLATKVFDLEIEAVDGSNKQPMGGKFINNSVTTKTNRTVTKFLRRRKIAHMYSIKNHFSHDHCRLSRWDLCFRNLWPRNIDQSPLGAQNLSGPIRFHEMGAETQVQVQLEALPGVVTKMENVVYQVGRKSLIHSEQRFLEIWSKYELTFFNYSSISNWHNFDFVSDDIGRGPSFALASTVYFKGTWKTAFDRSQTALMPFHTLRGDWVNILTMHASGLFRHGWIDEIGARFIELPYKVSHSQRVFEPLTFTRSCTINW